MLPLVRYVQGSWERPRQTPDGQSERWGLFAGGSRRSCYPWDIRSRYRCPSVLPLLSRAARHCESAFREGEDGQDTIDHEAKGQPHPGEPRGGWPEPARFWFELELGFFVFLSLFN